MRWSLRTRRDHHPEYGTKAVRRRKRIGGCYHRGHRLGSTDDIRNWLFEPFFTTKPAVGTGLGLWVTRRIVEQNGGKVELSTDTCAEHHGTRVSIVLPMSRPACDKARAAD